MPIADWLLYNVAKRWPAPLAERVRAFDAQPGTDVYAMVYAWHQFNRRVRNGLEVEVKDLDVLDIGCGRGGITCYAAVCGARSVIGIDLNGRSISFALRLKRDLEKRLGNGRLPIRFSEMNADHLGLPDGCLDLVIAECVFEHFTDPEKPMREAFRTLRPGGRLLVPEFTSIYSKYGLHLKNALKVPWANLLFTERTILRALHRLAEDDPEVHRVYPGLANNPVRVRDVRLHRDLNDITYGAFRKMAGAVGFEIEWFQPAANRIGKVVGKIPWIENTLLMDILSWGASACLRKPA